MNEPMTKTRFVELVQATRADLDASLAEVRAPRLEEPGLPGGWSVKDVIAHVVWHEREMLGIVQARRFEGSELWDLPLEQRNAAIFERNRARSLDDVLNEAREICPRLLAALQALSDEDLLDPSHFPGMPDDWQPWHVIASNTYEHYPDHARDIRAWLERAQAA